MDRKVVFKKKKKLGTSRKKEDNDEEETVTFRKLKPKPSFVKVEPKKANIAKWIADDSQIEGPGIKEGDIIAITEPEEHKNEEGVRKYVPKLELDLEQTLSKRQQLSQLAGEYGEDEEPAEVEITNDLQMNSDDEIAEAKMELDDKYDTAIGEVMTVTVEEEMRRLADLLKDLQIKKKTAEKQIEQNENALKDLDRQKAAAIDEALSV